MCDVWCFRDQVPGGVKSLSEAEKGRCKIDKDENGKEVVYVCSGKSVGQDKIFVVHRTKVSHITARVSFRPLNQPCTSG